MQAQDLLKLIETVDPDDCEKLVEIDWQVSLYLYPDLGLHRKDDGRVYSKRGDLINMIHSRYTRSRDALQTIRPDVIVRGIDQFGSYLDGKRAWRCIFGLRDHPGQEVIAAIGRTEELAELHAIIQAIELERTHNNQPAEGGR